MKDDDDVVVGTDNDRKNYFAKINDDRICLASSAFVRTRLKNLETNQVVERTFKAGVETVDTPDLEEREMEFNYGDMDGFNFMEQSTFVSE